jgi:ATPase family associated with various cellular activities (AAA)
MQPIIIQLVNPYGGSGAPCNNGNGRSSSDAAANSLASLVASAFGAAAAKGLKAANRCKKRCKASKDDADTSDDDDDDTTTDDEDDNDDDDDDDTNTDDDDVDNDDDATTDDDNDGDASAHKSDNEESEEDKDKDNNTKGCDGATLSNDGGGGDDNEAKACKSARKRKKQTAAPKVPKVPHVVAMRGNVAYDEYNDEEIEYYDTATRATRRKIDSIERRMKEVNETSIPLRFKVLLSEVDEKVKAVAMKKIEALASLDEASSEYHKILNWIDALCRLPINKYCSLPVTAASSPEAKKGFLLEARHKMNTRVYGHDKAKEQVLRLIAQWITNPSSKGMVIGIHGSMGVGKTTFVKDGICNVLGMPFAFIPLGGASDGCYLEGHSYTYEGSTWGKIIDVLMKCKVSNPVLYFDELDKVSESHRGDEIINKLIHLTDSSQNTNFSDKFFYDIELDLSRCLIIFSYNHEERVNPILRDRMVRIRTDGYNLRDKKKITQGYILPELLSEFALSSDDILFDDDLISFIVEYVEEEEGVRNLKRALHEIIASINLLRLVEPDKVTLPLLVTRQHVHDFVKTAIRNASLSNRAALHMYV